MKTLLPLLVLATVVSCGDKKSSPSALEQASPYIETITSKVGQVSHRKENGFAIGTEVERNSEKVILMKKVVNKEEKRTILKIENGNRYVLSEENDLTENVQDRTVYLEDDNDFDQLVNVIKQGKGKISNNTLIFSDNFNDENDVYGSILVTSGHFSGTFNLLKPMCEGSTTLTMTGTFTSEGKVTDIAPTTYDIKYICGETLSSAKLRAIDLKSVLFCDETNENDHNCSTKDMSFLTKDL